MATRRSNAKTAASGEAPIAKKQRAKKTTRARKQSRQPKNPLAENRIPNEAEQQSASLFPPGVQSLFGTPSQKPNEPAPKENHSTSESSAGENEDVRAKLDAIPDVIGETEEGSEEAGITSEDIGGLMQTIAFEEQDVRDALSEIFDWMSEKFGSDHWKLTERQARMMGAPTAQLLNSIWAKLSQRLPDVIARWCESTPGASAFLIACGIVVVPKVMKQATLSRTKKEELPRAKKAEPLTQAPTAEGTVFSGIPSATGMMGAAA